MRPTPEQRETAKLIAAELANNPEFMKVLAKGLDKVLVKRYWNERACAVIEESGVLLRRGKG